MYFKQDNLSGTIEMDPRSRLVTINGTFQAPEDQPVKVPILAYWAPNPVHRGYSQSGSGLPYATADMAYQNTINHGHVSVDLLGRFQITIKDPSPYYTRGGTILIPPEINIATPDEQVHNIQLIDRSFPSRPNRSIPR
jgi:hypothetical protein